MISSLIGHRGRSTKGEKKKDEGEEKSFETFKITTLGS